MKKSFYLLALTLIVSIGLASCNEVSMAPEGVSNAQISPKTHSTDISTENANLPLTSLELDKTEIDLQGSFFE